MALIEELLIVANIQNSKKVKKRNTVKILKDFEKVKGDILCKITNFVVNEKNRMKTKGVLDQLKE